MYRIFEQYLQEWKNDIDSKPLMVRGIRQIGKTYIIDKFAKENFNEYIYLNFEKQVWLCEIFEKTIDPVEIIKQIEFRLGKKINLKEAIIFFDEVQISEKCITSLKYFCESDLKIKIVCAGSLLGVKINRFESSFPVGKVIIKNMYPMCFEEFMLASDKGLLLEEIKKCYKECRAISEDLHELSLEMYRHFLCVGGMPESVKNYVKNNKDILLHDREILEQIVLMYKADMTKYTHNKLESVKINKLYDSLIVNLSNENKKFRYSNIGQTGGKRKFESSIDWLESSRMIYICNKLKKIELPLKAYKDINQFKIYFSDVGILNSVSENNVSDILLDNNYIYKGAITENYVITEMKNYFKSAYYWTSDNTAEVDFILNTKSDGVVPIEVKSSTNIKSKSLEVYNKKYKPKYLVRFSTKNFGISNNIKSIPLYAIFEFFKDVR